MTITIRSSSLTPRTWMRLSMALENDCLDAYDLEPGVYVYAFAGGKVKMVWEGGG